MVHPSPCPSPYTGITPTLHAQPSPGGAPLFCRLLLTSPNFVSLILKGVTSPLGSLWTKAGACEGLALCGAAASAQCAPTLGGLEAVQGGRRPSPQEPRASPAGRELLGVRVLKRARPVGPAGWLRIVACLEERRAEVPDGAAGPRPG